MRCDDGGEPSPIDRAVLDVVLRVLAEYEADAAEVRHEWGEEAGMWFTEVEPGRPDAAPLSLSFDGQDILSVTIGRTWFEVFPFGDEESLAYLRGIVGAVLAGHVEQCGSVSTSFARVHVALAMAAGPQVRRYEPYGGAR